MAASLIKTNSSLFFRWKWTSYTKENMKVIKEADINESFMRFHGNPFQEMSNIPWDSRRKYWKSAEFLLSFAYLFRGVPMDLVSDGNVLNVFKYHYDFIKKLCSWRFLTENIQHIIFECVLIIHLNILESHQYCKKCISY